MSADRFGIGGNLPPEPITDPLDASSLRARLEREYAPQIDRMIELELGAATIAPRVIEDDTEDQKVLDFLTGQCGDAVTKAKNAHDLEKKPYLACSRLIDDFFLRRIERFTLAIAPVKRRHDDYMLRRKQEQRLREAEERRKAAEEYARAQAEVLRLREEAQKKEAARQRRAATDLMHQAEIEQGKADHAAQIAVAPGAPVHQHGNLTPATSYITEEWDYEVEDPAAVPEGYKMVDDQAVRAAIKRGVRVLAGIRIFAVDKVRQRRC